MFKSKKKQKAEFLASYAKIKSESFDFEKIEKYFKNLETEDRFQRISDKTYQDLDMDELFMFMDRTVSRVGQQFLYFTLRTIPNGSTRIEKLEEIIRFYKENPALKESILLQVSRLNNNEAYFLSFLFQEEHISRPKWFWCIQLLSLSSILSIVLSFFFPQFLIVLFSILAINYFIHYWNKKNLYQYAGAIPELLKLNQIAKEIVKSKAPSAKGQELTQGIKAIDSLGKQTKLFMLEPKFKSEMELAAEHFVEMIKALFLIEPILLFSILDKLGSKRKEIHEVYKLVGEIDAAISVDSLRNSLPYSSLPTLTNRRKFISGREVYHPLLPGFIANSIELEGKSALLTGSNMSGKTTFIRTIGINAIVAQTINTCFAQDLVMPKLKVHSAIRITDDLMSDKSYYFEEVLTIKTMLDESGGGGQNLFLLDELFKGTNTVERIAAGKSVLNYLNREDNLVFISTHDLEMATYLERSFSLYHFTEIVENESILFDYKIKEGNLKSTNAIRILELNNYPLDLIEDARQLARELNKVKEANSSI